MDIIGSVLKHGGLVQLLGGKHREVVILKDDESYQENCEWIWKQLGNRKVKIQKDMPSIYDGCGLDIAPASIMENIDAKMMFATFNILQAIKAEQAANDGFISFSRVNKLFAENETDFVAVVEDDICTTKHLFHTEGWNLDFVGAQNKAMMHKARQVMQDCVNEKGTKDTWDSLNIKTEELCNIFAQKGVKVKNVGSFLGDSDTVARIAIDIGLTRFPRVEDPFFRVHRFRVMVYQCKERILMFHTNSAGLFCRFQSRKYDMTKAFTRQFTEELEQKVHAKFQSNMAKFMED